jgi:spore maturation protein CgeB
MKLVIFGLSVSSAWGNGHATLWRALCKALAKRGHRVVFFEHDVPYYAAHRDIFDLPQGELILYNKWEEALPTAQRHISDCDVAMTTSYCPDAIAATELITESAAPVRCFYDLDSPVTLDRLNRGFPVDYVGNDGFRGFDLVLSYAGGEALSQLQSQLGARAVAPLFGCVDPEVHYPVDARNEYRADLSYLGTHAADRDQMLRTLLVEPAKRLRDRKFIIGGAMYDDTFPWESNIFFLSHVPPPEHPAFYCSAKLNLNVTRLSMARNGYCPSGRLFEAAACGTAILSDQWAGLSDFFEPGREILTARTTDEAIDALSKSPEDLTRISRSARERTLEEHTADVRVRQLEYILESLPAGFHEPNAATPVLEVTT